MKNKILLVAGIAVIAGGAMAAEKIPGVFKRNDLDQDSRLNKEEYIAARTAGSKDWFVKSGPGLEAWKEKHPNPTKQFGEDFPKWDTNGDGYVDVDEFLNKGKKK